MRACFLEILDALFAGDHAPSAAGQPLRRQPVGNQEYVVSLRLQGTQDLQRLRQIGTTTWNQRTHGADRLIEFRAAIGGEPASIGTRQHGAHFVVESVDLVLRAWDESRADPIHCIHGLLPFFRATFGGVIHIPPPDHVDDGVIEHAGRNIKEDQRAFAPHLDAGQILAITFTCKGSHLLRFRIEFGLQFLLRRFELA